MLQSCMSEYVLSVWCICYMYNVYYIHGKSKSERETESPHSKRHTAINPPQNTPPRFEHTYTTFLLLSEAVLEVVFRECL